MRTSEPVPLTLCEDEFKLPVHLEEITNSHESGVRGRNSDTYNGVTPASNLDLESSGRIQLGSSRWQDNGLDFGGQDQWGSQLDGRGKKSYFLHAETLPGLI